MKDQRNTSSKQERNEIATKHLLGTRAKQIKLLQADVAGYEETVKLCAAFIGQLTLAFMEDDKTEHGVSGTREGEGVFALSISKQALSDAIGKWQLRIEKKEAAYRILVEEKKKEN